MDQNIVIMCQVKATQKCRSALLSVVEWRISSNMVEVRVRAYFIKSL